MHPTIHRYASQYPKARKQTKTASPPGVVRKFENRVLKDGVIITSFAIQVIMPFIHPGIKTERVVGVELVWRFRPIFIAQQENVYP